MMLDTRATFNEVISKVSPDDETRDRVLSNGIYKHISDTLSASHDYMASEKLYDLYKGYASMDEIPAKQRARIEKQLFKKSLDEVWEGTRAYWQERDPKQVEKAERDGRHKMALTFRWYLGMTSRWARTGDKDRKRDFQVWCGPSMGGFNTWARGTELEALDKRTVVGIADALMQGAAQQGRQAMARALGLT